MRARPRLTALASLILLVAILVGLPVILWAIGANPLPQSVPSLEQIRSALTTPDDGTLALGAVKLLAWAAWVVLAVSILLEVAAKARGVRAPHLPGLGMPQVAARQLVGAAALLFVLTPSVTSAAIADPGARTVVTTTSSVVATASTGTASSGQVGAGASHVDAHGPHGRPHDAQGTPASVARYVVRDGDTLTAIAGRELGDQQRWPELAQLNPEVSTHPDLIHPGTVLRVPAGQQGIQEPQEPQERPGQDGAASATTAYTVQAGDTLSAIAEHQLGNASAYPAIFEASKGTVQPGGTHLSDPDRIDVGQHLTIPSDPHTAADPAPAAPDRLVPPAAAHHRSPATPAAPFRSAPSPAPAAPEAPASPHHGDTTVDHEGQAGLAQPPVSAGTPVPTVPTVPTGARTGARTSGPSGMSDAAPSQAVSAADANDGHGDGQMTQAPWMLAGLTGAGAVLSGSLLLMLQRRRRSQFRGRRPGRTLLAPEPVLTPVEKTLLTVGAVTAPTVEHMDALLRRLASAAARDGSPMPELAAVELTGTHVVLHLSSPAALSPPWVSIDDLETDHLATDHEADDLDDPRESEGEPERELAESGDPDGLAVSAAAKASRVQSRVLSYHWMLSPDTDPDEVGPDVPDQPAPYPLLVTIGLGHDDEVWLLNLEDQDVSIVGDLTYGQDFARYVAAEVACNPWSAGVDMTCLGVATESALMNPERIHTIEELDGLDGLDHPIDLGGGSGSSGSFGHDLVRGYLDDARKALERSRDAGLDVATARAHQCGADAWPARLLLVDAGNIATDSTAAAGSAAVVDGIALDLLLNLVHRHPGQTATSVVVRGHRAQTPGTVLEVTADGRVRLAAAGLDLVAVGLTADEARGCAALMAHTDTVIDVPVPVDPDATTGWRSWSDEAGALRPQHTLPRHGEDSPAAGPTAPELTPEAARATTGPVAGDGEGQALEDTTPLEAAESAGPAESVGAANDPAKVVGHGAGSLLDDGDEVYTQVAATTAEDLQVLAPRVTEQVRRDVEDSDPHLDDDVAMWFRDDAALPKLRLLGPVRASTRGKPLTKRKPYMTELLAFIALRRLGATPDEVAQAFSITKVKARDYALTIRQWLGINPRTGEPHLPDARRAPSAAVRSVPVYEVVDLLIDVDLFRRLRVRGEARGAAGVDDLRTALRLVEGRPFDYPIEREGGGGWAWLVEGDRLDEHMAVAIVDVAHIVTTHALAQGDLPTARLAAETAALAAPYEEIPRLDLAAVATAEGHHAEARRIIRDEICNRTDDEGAPLELPARTEQVLQQRKAWLDSRAS